MSAEVCITGMGLAASLGLSVGEVWGRVVSGACGMGATPAMEQALPEGSDGGQAPELPGDFWPGLPREARYLRWAIDAAWEEADVERRAEEGKRVALILGTTLHGMRAAGRFLRSGRHEELAAFLAGDTVRLATQGLRIDGLRVTTCSACSSSLGALALGATWLGAGRADVVIAGGYDPVSEYAWGGFNALRVVSAGPLRPFGRGRTGMKLAEGYAVVALERAVDAASRALVTVAGWGESADAFHLTRPEPGGRGALAAMRQAAERAGVSAGELGMVAAHATGTQENDASEGAALGEFLAGAEVPVVGFKSHLGHTLGGAGAAELILSAMAMRSGKVPPCANVDGVASDFPSLRISTVAQAREVGHALNTSLGFGGANTCVVLSRDARPAAAATSLRGVVVTGVGVVLPGAVGNAAFLAAGGPPERRTVEDAEIEHLVSARRARRMSPYVKLQLAAAGIAIAEAGLGGDPAALRGASVILGTTHGSASYCYDYYAQVVREGVLAANPMLFAEGVPNAAAAQLSLMLGIQGGCQTLIGTTTAGLDALRLAAARIATGACERVVVGAAEEAHFSLDEAYESCHRGAAPSCACAVAFVVEPAEAAARSPGLGAPLFADAADGVASAPFRWSGDCFSVGPLLRLARGVLRGESTTVSQADRTGAFASVSVG